jgi:zinc protease
MFRSRIQIALSIRTEADFSMKKPFILSILALFSFLFVLSAGTLAQEIDIPYQRFVLGNGLTLIVHEDHKAPIVAIDVWYQVGSRNEKPGKTGFAHLFEHLMFEGSENAKGRFVDIMERIGATETDGETNSDRTNYFENVPSSALDFVLWMESDRMGHLLGAIDQNVLDLQRGVVQNEKREHENLPYGAVEELVPQNTYPPGHPYSWTPIGDMADLNAASLTDVQEWFRTYYGPSNVVLVLAGDIETKTAKEKVEKYFGDIPAGRPVIRQKVWLAKMTGAHRQSVQANVSQARIYKFWNAPEYGSADADYLDLVSDVLTLGKSSRFYKRLVYDDQIAVDANAYISECEIGSQFGLQVTVRPGQDLQQVGRELDEELAQFLKEGPTLEELTRVKANHEANFIRDIERIGGSAGKAARLAQGQAFLGSPDAYKKTLKHIQEATAEDLKVAANKWLSDGVFVLEVQPFPNYKAASTGADRSQVPSTGTPPDLRLPKLQRTTLSNGLRVVLAERHEIPMVNFWMTIDAGFAADQSAIPGTASIATWSLVGGTVKRSALQISDEQLLLGAQLSAFSNLDQSIVKLSALKSKLDRSLDLFADVILNPAFSEEDFRRQQGLTLAEIEREQTQPKRMALRILPGLIYGANHAYGNPLTGTGTTESVKKIRREDLVRFHQTWFRPNNATLVVTGDTSLSELKPKLEKLFESWKPAQIPKKNIAEVALAGKSVVYLIDRPGSQQSTIIAGQIAPPTTNPREIAIQAMNDGIGGTFGSRLNMNLREDKHWSYGANTQLLAASRQRMFLAIAPAQTDKTKESMAEMDKEFRGIVGDRPIGADELTRIQADETLKLPASRETLDEVGKSILDLMQFGLADDYYESYAGKVRALKPSDISDAAKMVIHPNQLIWIVVGDRAKIEAGVKELQLGELHYLTADGKSLQN